LALAGADFNPRPAAQRAATVPSDLHSGSGLEVLGVLRPSGRSDPPALGLAGVDQEELRAAISCVV
jgi:hypothetical protein